MIYKHASPAQSTTSLSENDDDDVNKSNFFGSDSVVVTPAQWSSRLRHLPSTRASTHSSMSHLPPEILIHILKHLHSPRDLYNALRVSRSWCECSVELLWHRPSLSKVPTLVKMMQVLSRNNQTFTYARFIRRLNFLFLGGDLTDSLFSRLAQCDRLERLTLVNCASISDEPLARVLPCLPNLVAIDLTGVAECTDRAIVGLASVAKRLQGINLGGCRKVSDRGILALANNCPLLRRVKLSGVDLLTDDSVSALAKNCPLLLEIDLNNCKRITDQSVRDIWLHSNHMREMRLSHCTELTDAAFPAPLRPDSHTPPANNPFPTSTTKFTEELPPLVLTRSFDHLRMLDLTACSLISDDAVEGIIAHAGKIRNIVFSKCTKLTDRTVEIICRLGKHLHYLHLGHAAQITDRSVRTLARCCTRLRYVDFANCVLLTDMSVFELSSLPKLRRIGLVRVNNLTDEAIYQLANRHATLERIHLSYCDQISVMAIHFLLDKLHKLTHLSLTGIPAFRKPELQQFCRQPPSEFNMSQRAAFCVYSGKGVSELRNFLTELFNSITEDMNQDDDTEYEDEYETTPDAEMETGNEGDDDEDYTRSRDHNHYAHAHSQQHLSSAGHQARLAHGIMNLSSHPELAIQRDRTIRASATQAVASPEPRPAVNGRMNGQSTNGQTSNASRRTTGRAFGQQPVVETSTSPTPSDVASNRSTGTNQSNGAFFRTYPEAASSSRSNGALTPDLNFAEIGHGRGAANNSNSHVNLLSHTRRGIDPAIAFSPMAGPSSQGISQTIHSSASQLDVRNGTAHDRAHAMSDSSNSYHRSADGLVAWPHVQHESASPSPPASPTTRALHESVQSALSASAQDSRETAEGRGRRVKRSLRNTFVAAESFANSFLLGRGASNGVVHSGNTNWSHGTDNGAPER